MLNRFNGDGSNLGGEMLVRKGLLREETFKLTARAQGAIGKGERD